MDWTHNPNAISRISSGMKVSGGAVTLEHDLRIDGSFEGDMTSCARVIVGESAVVKGSIICSNLDVFGEVDGKIIVKECLSMKKGCRISGEVHAANIISETGTKLKAMAEIIEGDAFDTLTEGNEFLHSTPAD